MASLVDAWAGYARTVVEIDRGAGESVAVRPAPRAEVGEWPWESHRPVHILTAWDPGDERPGEAENRRRQVVLERELRTLAGAIWPATGTDPLTGHREEGTAVCGMSEAEALALGARHGQEAIFSWTPSRWAIVACVGGRREILGWSLEWNDHRLDALLRQT